MGRGSKSRQRDTSAIANYQLLSPLLGSRPQTILQQIEDRRYFHPEQINAPARSFKKSQHRLVLPAPSKKAPQKSKAHPLKFPAAQIGFEAPSQVLVCVRRKRRKEVLHALNKTGKRGRGKSRRRTWLSNIQCR